MRDCVFLLADSNMEGAITGFFSKENFHTRIGCGVFQFGREDIIVAAGDNDPGIYTRGHELVRPYIKTHRYAIIILDAAWEGSPGSKEIQCKINDNMIGMGYDAERFRVIVIDPELENWIWQRNPHVADALGCSSVDELIGLAQKYCGWPETQAKPNMPKEALEAILKEKRIPRSSAIYKKITQQVSIKGCQDNSFLELKEALCRWFPVSEVAE